MEIQNLNNKIQKLLKEKSYSLELINEIEIEINAFGKEKALTIIDLLKFNLNNEDVKSLHSILQVLFSTYNFDGETEQKINLALIEVLSKLSELYLLSGNLTIETCYYVIFDIYFHNTGLIDELDLKMNKSLISEIEKISRFKYSKDEKRDSDLLMALQKIIDITFYFGDELGEEILKNNFLNHFDEFIVLCAKDELQTNLPDIH